MGYNAGVVSGYGKLCHIEPGDKLNLPLMKLSTFQEVEDTLFALEDMLVKLLAASSGLHAAHAKIRKDKENTKAAYAKQKVKLDKLEAEQRASKELDKNCRKLNETTGKSPGLAALVKCIVDAAPSRELEAVLRDHRRRVDMASADKAEVEKGSKKIDGLIQKHKTRLDAVRDHTTNAQNFFLKLMWQMYG